MAKQNFLDPLNIRRLENAEAICRENYRPYRVPEEIIAEARFSQTNRRKLFKRLRIFIACVIGFVAFVGFRAWKKFDLTKRPPILRILQGSIPNGSSQSGPLVFSPDGHILASPVHTNLPLKFASSGLELWDPLSGNLQRKIEMPNRREQSIAFSPDGRIIVTGGCTSGDPGSCDIQLLDSHSGSLLRKIPVSSATRVSFSPDGKVLASGGFDASVELWDPNLGTLIRTLQHNQPQAKVLTFEKSIQSLVFNQDSRTIAVANGAGEIKLWNTSSSGGPRILQADKIWGQSLAFSPSGDILASNGYDGTIRLWATASGSLIRTFRTKRDDTGPSFLVDPSLSFRPDGRILASNLGTAITLRAVSSGDLIKVIRGQPKNGSTQFVTTVAFSPDGTILASTYGNETIIKLWDVSNIH